MVCVTMAFEPMTVRGAIVIPAPMVLVPTKQIRYNLDPSNLFPGMIDIIGHSGGRYSNQPI